MIDRNQKSIKFSIIELFQQAKIENLLIDNGALALPPDAYDRRAHINYLVSLKLPSTKINNMFQIMIHHIFCEFDTTFEKLNLRPQPFGNFSKLLNSKYCYKIKKNSQHDDAQVIMCNEGHVAKYVVKRSSISFCYYQELPYPNDDKRNQSYIENLEKGFRWLEKQYNDYEDNYLLAMSEHFQDVLDFKVVYLSHQNILLAEVIQEYGGISLSEFTQRNISFCCAFVHQMKDILCYQQYLLICQNDLKPDNIIVNILPNEHFLIKIIDFDICENLVFTDLKTNVLKLRGYSPIYVSPEIFCFAKKVPFVNSKNEEIDIWKSQIYSFGMILLDLVGFFSKKMEKSKVDDYKLSSDAHNKFIDLIHEFKLTQDDIIIRKILTIAKIALTYNPIDRPSGWEFSYICDHFEKMTENQIQLSYDCILVERKFDPGFTKKYRTELKAKIDHFQKVQKSLNITQMKH